MTLRLWALLGMLMVVLAGCSGPIGLYHSVEGGAIAQPRQAPPGADQPYPNLASVPAAPVALSPAQKTAVSQRVRGVGHGAGPAVSAPASGALAGLELPAAPPLPDVPGMVLQPAAPPAAPPPVARAPKPPAPQHGAPVALGFAPGSAVLTHEAVTILAGLAASRGQANLLVGGFGEAKNPAGDEAGLRLALARARRLADGLTAAGVPPQAITLTAAAAGSGGFVQLVY